MNDQNTQENNREKEHDPKKTGQDIDSEAGWKGSLSVFWMRLCRRLQDFGLLSGGSFHSEVAQTIWKKTMMRLKIYTGVCLALLFVILQFKELLQQHFWQPNNLYYRILHFLNEWRYRIPLLLYGAGVIVIIFAALRKAVHYLDFALEASEKIADEKDELIELPADFKQIETQFNAVKLEIQNNARAAKEAEQRKNDLVVYLAHDLKTPLTSVIGYLTLLADEPEIPEKLRQKYLGIALDKAERLEDLINEFFEITRFNLTHIALEMGNINLTRLLEQLVYEFSPILKEKRLTCRLEALPDVQFYCDGDKMQRVFDNLLRNAVNYSYPDTQIQIRLERTGQGLHLSFLNHGNTIPEDKLNRLFEQFFRLDSSRASGSGGAGLGLAIAKEIVELHKGTIRASSREGTILFEIFFPETGTEDGGPSPEGPV